MVRVKVVPERLLIRRSMSWGYRALSNGWGGHPIGSSAFVAR